MARAKTRADGLIEKTKVINGKQMHFYGSTLREVQKKIDEAIAAAAEKSEQGDMFEDVAEQFWQWKEPKIKYGAAANYRSKVYRAIGWFSGYGMKELSSTEINRRLSKMAMQGYAYKTIAGQKSVINLIYQYWCANMDGDRNPCDLIKLQQGLKREKRRAPTDEEIAFVKSHTDGFGLCAAFMMYAGLRLGEALALQKRDLAGGQLSITKALVWHSNKAYIETPKTENAIRTVPIFAPLLEAIGTRLDDMAETDYIFGGKTLYTKSKYRNAWLQYCASIGCVHDSGQRYKAGKTNKEGEEIYKAIMAPDFTAHQLRHEFASVLVQCQISPVVVKELMGHADIATTNKWYAEAKKSAVEEAAEIVNRHYHRN